MRVKIVGQDVRAEKKTLEERVNQVLDGLNKGETVRQLHFWAAAEIGLCAIVIEKQADLKAIM